MSHNETHDRIVLAGEQIPSLVGQITRESRRPLPRVPADSAVRFEELQRLLGRVMLTQLRVAGMVADRATRTSTPTATSTSTSTSSPSPSRPAPSRSTASAPASGARAAKLLPLYQRWLDESLRTLSGMGYLVSQEDQWTVADLPALDSAAIWAEWDARKAEWEKDERLGSQIRIVDATLRALPEILTGSVRATDILFPDSSTDFVAGAYKRNDTADYFNNVLADTVAELVEARLGQDAGARLRLLEIGAGTGGTSEWVFERLKAHGGSIAEYCYTDISKAFLLHAQKSYAPTTPFLTTRLFNVEQALAPQDIDAGSYDIVIATNVLHATRNIRNTLRNAKAALKRNGVLLLNEMASHTLFTHLTFGLLEGWWLYEDAPLRIPGSPALSPESWGRVLKSEGFPKVLFPARAAHGLGQQIVVAESDGMIRQPQPQPQPQSQARAQVKTPAAVASRTGRKQPEKLARNPRAARVPAPATVADSAPQARAASGGTGVRQRAVAALKRMVGATLDIPVRQLDENEPLDQYGIDSILVVKLTNELKAFFPDISSTLFFEHRTIAATVDHFLRVSPEALAKFAGSSDEPAVGTAAAAAGGAATATAVGTVAAAAGTGSRASMAKPAGKALPRRPRSVPVAVPASSKPRAVADGEAAASCADIAIIGMSGRYPKARTLQEYWENLLAGRSCISEIPGERWDHSQYFDPERGRLGKSYSRWGGFIDGADEFDPLFFRISPVEAERMDPQERLFLQEAWACIEDAGYTPATLSASRKVGVYVGVMNSTYFRHSSYWSIANRVSYFCDFQGPSMAVDTACSSSLTAIHLAAEGIRNGSCECAIAGGVNLIVDPVQYLNLSALTMLSSDDRCKSFGAGADGFVDGEGVGALVLKPLARAVREGDHIYGVVKASAINAGGKTNGYTVPNPTAQRDVVEDALRRAGVDARRISYVEAHGTGTSLGDPIEIAGLTQAFERYTQDRQFCAIGSVKSNIGHLESAAGVAAVAKVLLQMQHRTLVPSLHAQELNPHIDFARTPFRVQQSVAPWEGPRIAGVSSFGAGGANAHLVVEEYVGDAAGAAAGVVISARCPALIVLSARSEEQLRERARQLIARVSQCSLGQEDLAAIAYTLQVGRVAMEHRLACTATSMAELVEKLTAYVEGKVARGAVEECYCGELRQNRDTLSIFNTDSALREAVATWVEQGEFGKLLDLWTRGLEFDWSSLYAEGAVYGGMRPRRLSLPTYPFAREKYWVPESALQRQLEQQEQAAAQAGASTPLSLPSQAGVGRRGDGGASVGAGLRGRGEDGHCEAGQGNGGNVWPGDARSRNEARGDERAVAAADAAVEHLLFTEEWEPCELVSPSGKAGAGTLVVMLSDPARQAQLLQVMKQLNGDTRVVFVAQAGEAAATCGVSSGERVSGTPHPVVDSQELVAANDQCGRHVVQRDDATSYASVLSGIAQSYGPIQAVWYLWPLEDTSCIQDETAIAFLLQALAASGSKDAKVLLAASYGTASERCFLESWVAYERSARLAVPGLQVAAVHADRQTKACDFEQWCRRLWEELQPGTLQSALYANGKRHALRVKALSRDLEKRATRLRTGGTYLITGGLGALGYRLAGYLARQYQANLILTGRSALDAERQARLSALESLGGKALYVAAEVSDAEQMRAAVEQALAKFGALHGVIHAAGVEGAATLLTQDARAFTSILAPKISGTRVLHELTQERELDFLCYFSSSSAILGDFGSCSYSLANRFALAHARYVEPRAVAICWPLWADGGMAVGDGEATQLYLKSSGQRALRTDDGMRLFEQALALHGSEGVSHALVMVGEPSRIHRMLGLTQVAVPREQGPVAHRRGRPPQLQGLTVRQCVLWELGEIVSALLKLPREKLDIEENLANFGFDSIGLANFAKHLSGHYEVELLPSVFFSHPTLAQLADHLIAEHGQTLERYYSEQAPTARHETTEAGQAAQVARRDGVAVAPGSDAGRDDRQAPAATRAPTQSPLLHARGVVGESVHPADTLEPIAIVGMSGRFPGARNVEEFWQVLASGREAVAEIPLERFDWRPLYCGEKLPEPGALVGKTNSKWMGCVPGVDEFDAAFFEISPKEAELMDPRQRLLLQESYSALEDAGYAVNRGGSPRRIGVFVGVEQGDYQVLAAGRGGGVVVNHDAILASRLSYFLNLSGPVMAINTACSSGLVAAHQACQSLRAGECDAAIASAANLILTPYNYVGMTQAGMLSPDGRCYAFDRRANGLVPGEAVVAVVLKRLSQAQADRDEIHAVILASGVNYDGKTNGITAPSGAAQAALLEDIYTRANIDRAGIEYIVTHGTGTRLGDPVEINALRAAFRDAGQGKPYCALTSTKTNFGHTFAASGLVSLVSLVQALRHETIPASLHCEQLSDYIDWSRGPFFVNPANRAWPKRKDAPRRGALSAFGMSGTNAHMVVQGWDEEADEVTDSACAAPCYLLALSGKTEAALQRRAADLLDFLRHENATWNGARWAAISHTLLNHRQHFSYRCAIVVGSREQALHALESVARGERLPTVLRWKVDRDFVEQPMLVEYARNVLDGLHSLRADPERYRQSLSALGDLYCHGYQLDWRALFGSDAPRRISLPTYPFACERFWVETGSAAKAQPVVAAAVLHPLAQRNTSRLGEQRFSSTLSGEEFYVADHVVNGQRVLAEAAYLEMARAALLQSMGLQSGAVELRDIEWVRPLPVQNACEAHIALYADESGEIEFEVYTEGTAEDGTVHAQGRVALLVEQAADTVSLSSLRSRCDTSIGPEQCYAAFAAMGTAYGAAHRGLSELHVGKDADGERFMLGQIQLPACVSDTHDQYVLHPSVLDSALQAGIGMSLNELMGGTTGGTVVPFALERLQVFERCPRNATVWVRRSASTSGSASAGGAGAQKLDLDVCDESGRVCVRLQGFTSRVLEGVAKDSKQAVLLVPGWQAKPAAGASVSGTAGAGTAGAAGGAGEYAQRWVWIDSLYKEQLAPLQATSPGVQWALLPEGPDGSDGSDSGAAVMAAAEALFGQVQQIVQGKPKQPVLLQVVLAGEGGCLKGAVSGLLKTAQQENPKVIGQLLELPAGASVEQLLSAVQENANDGARTDSEIRYTQGMREVAQLKELAASASASADRSTSPAELPWKDGGVYLITGGAGGLGLIFAREIAARARGTTLILTGRSELGAEKQAQLQQLRDEFAGTRVVYQALDVADAAAVDRCVQTIVDAHGTLTGVIHSAGVINDNFILKKSAQELQRVMAAKVAGTINLDEATRDVPLEWMILFSSLAGAFGGVGQCDYAMANAFLDRYARYRTQLTEQGKRHGRTLSINWPLWESGGMRVDEQTQLAMRRQGLCPMATADGIDALYRALRTDAPQVVVFSTDGNGAGQRTAAPKTGAAQPRNPTAAAQIDTTGLQEKVQAALVQAIREELKMKSREVDVEAELSELGFDSISLTGLCNTLNQAYSLELTPTIFFEYPTIRSFAAYLSQEHTPRMAARLLSRSSAKTVSAARPTAASGSVAGVPIPAPNVSRRRGAVRPGRSPATQVRESRAERIAIIGMSGCFPGARDLDAFWDNLKNGRDSISEIPPSRWDWKAVYGDPATQPNKTNIKWGGFINGVDEFDPLYFGISPREAMMMDPQQRLLMTHTLKAIEDAGYSASSLSGTSTGIFVGTINSGYGALAAESDIAVEYSSTSVVSSVGPNRMSFFLNVHGPSEPIETACSSSLVAIHRAVRAMQAGDCEMALVGGINTMLTPWAHISLNAAGMLCEDGRCKTFSKNANGYVRGEGAAMLFLKKLSAAERDRDPIYALIAGSSENHGGRANSLTAPNPKAQAELIKAAYREAQVDPRTVTYIETHGTGTSLGDPIEINGLKSAFAALYADRDAEIPAGKPHCGLGSVKTNIGHLEMAAGVAGLIKVLLQLQHKTLAPSLHCEEVNPYIQLQDSPFYIVTREQPWNALRDAQGRELPRRAGVSSFGFGGANAHVVIEEYCAPVEAATLPQAVEGLPALIVLSARSQDRLQEQARQLLNFLSRRTLADADLLHVAFTLQIGREAMEHRFACTATTTEELQRKLTAYLAGETIDECYAGELKKNKDTLTLFNSDEVFQQTVATWVQQGKFSKLLELWVKGLSFDWQQLYRAGSPYEALSPRRMRLPTYPFARDRYWLEPSRQKPKGEAVEVLHPLVHRNTSCLGEQRFSTTLSAEAFYLSDHVIHGQRILPGVAYLEMARAAVLQSLVEEQRQSLSVELEDVVWMRPLVVESTRQVEISLQADDNGDIEFEVSTQDGEAERVVHAQGRVVLSQAPEEADRLVIPALRSDQIIEAQQYYEAFDAVGMQYGAAHRALKRVQIGEEASGERVVVAQIELPGCVGDTHGQYVLHPSVLDASLQAGFGLWLQDVSGDVRGKGAVPFALERLQILKGTPRSGTVLVRRMESTGDVQKLDVQLCDESGELCVRLQGYTSRILQVGSADSRKPVLLQPVWTSKPAVESTQAGAACEHHWVWLDPAFKAHLDELRRRSDAVRWNVLDSDGSEGAGVISAAEQVFADVQRIMQGKLAQDTLLQVVLGEGSGLAGALSGLMKSAPRENPHLKGQVIELSSDAGIEQLLAALQENAAGAALADIQIRYREGAREVLELKELPAAEQGASPWKDDGVYLITGGTGGLGLIFAREILQRVARPTLILAGLSALNGPAQEKVANLSREFPEARIEYQSMDVSDAAAVTRGIQHILQEHGALHGIVHTAGVIHDNFILKKPMEEISLVLRPKVLGTMHLDEATRDVELDWMLLFSSIAGAFGGVGQSDYSMANAFMDRYAMQSRRRGRIVSINWPLWESGGMRMEASIRESMRRQGLDALSTESGIEVLYRAWSSSASQVVVLPLNGRHATASAAADTPKPPVKEAPAKTAAASDTTLHVEDLQKQASDYLTKLLAGVLKLPADQIESDAGLEKYGIDSILAVKLVTALEAVFGPLPKTLMFEYQSIDALAGYFLASHRAELLTQLGPQQAGSAKPANDGGRAERSTTAVSTAKPASAAAPRRRNVPRVQPRSARNTAQATDVAIIGVSGRYPGARDLDEYWENLKAGKDCITEVPKERWDHSQYFHPEKGQPGKSYTKWGGFIDGVEEFDPLFFNISPREAVWMDPQERLFLQCVYATIEDAGYTRAALKSYRGSGLDGNVGVFVGMMYEEYQLYGAQAQALGQPFALSGNPSSIANRVSYFFNFHGPSMSLDTMCSGSLTAIHLACESLKNNGCELAIAGGVNVTVHPNKYLLLSQGQFASSNGRCESFGKGGDGYVPGEGVGAVLLKPLAQAEADGDHIYAVIKGTSINHGGKTNGYTVPNPVAQAQVIAQALKQSGVDARAISYIEAHGTGTSLGDPIEISGLTQAFSQYTQERQYCAIGSAKSNIGHLESAAGIAGVTKVLLQMKHGLLVPSLHSEVLNPHIDFERTPFRVQRSLAEWQRPVLEANGVKREYPRIAGISSFGAGGSNAHVIVEEYRAPVQVGVPAGLERPALVILSAKSELQLKEQAGRLRMHLSKGNVAEEELRNLAYTLQVGREAFEYRLAFTARTLAEAEEKLAAYAEGREGVEESYSGQVKREKDTLSLLSADEELQEAIDKWVQRGKYGKLLELWVKGLPFDWMRLYEGDAEGERPRRISLPTYPFARERHWVDVTPPSVTSAVPQLEAGTRSERVLVKAWSPAPGSEEARELGAALILCTERTQPFAECIAQGLREAQIVSLDGRQASVGQIDWQRYSTWIDVLGCEPTAHHDLKWTSLLQQWVDGGPAQGALALCVTRGLEAHGNPAPNLGGADRVGLYRMLSSEYARIASRHVDVDPAAAEPTQAQQVVTELSRLRDEIEVCYRDGMRYVAALKEISDNLRHDAALPAWPDEHVLWITGGTRGIGYTCAEHFVRRHGVKRLVLSGRDAFPPREEWQRLQAEQTPMAEKIRSILALEATGAEVRVLSVPLSDEAAVREAVQAIRQSWGPISGVIHCAGLADSGNPAFVRKTVASIQRVLEPKVAGLDCLMNCLAEEPLRFFLLFSSVSAVVPSLGVGYSDYAMANAYMDYVAQAHASRLPILSIQWPSWKETGMGENRSPRYRQLGFFSHTSAEGLSFLDRLLARQWGPVVLPAIVEASQWKPERLMRPPTQEVPQDRQRPVKRDAVPSRQPDSDSTLSSVRTWIVDLVARELRMDAGRIDVDAPLTDYGVDSVMLMQLMKTIGERVGETIDPSLLFEYPTIEGFSGWLARTHGAAFEQADAVTTVSEMRPTDVGVAREVQPPAPITTATATTTTRSTPPPTPTHAATRDVPVGRAGEPAASGRLQPGRVDTSSADIAVVGMSCRFPGAPNVDEYWRLLVEGRSALRRVPPERWGYATDHHAGVLDDANLFDPAFFLISPADARAMDPQALLVLEQSLMLWYQAGYTHADVKARAIGVYLGARSQHFPDEASLAAAANPIMAVGPNYLATNISRFFDLRGPSIVIDTACSSALVAMNMAMQSIRCGEIESALVGGVSLLNNDGALRMFSQRGILNRDVAFHLFDRRATGAILGEGAGMVWLKTVDQALRDGDAIYAVIKGLAINNDGRTAGPAAPNLQAQKDVMLAALARAGRKPQDITHVEVNGSGTEVTDLLELKAIEAVYRPSDATPCELGSMKPNIGHPLCAEGIASFIKGVLTVHHRHSVPFLSAVEPMRHYDLSASPFRFARSAGVPGTGPTTLAINCFADGGTNAHVILEAWNETRAATEVRVPVSAPRLTKVDCRPPRREDVPERSRAPGNEVIPHDTTPRKAGIWGDLSPARVVVKAEVHGKPLVNGHSAIQ